MWLLAPGELAYNYQDPDGKGRHYPAEFQEFQRNSYRVKDDVGEHDHDGVIARYRELVHDQDHAVAARAAHAWLGWDCLGSSVLSTVYTPGDDDRAIACARIGLHLYTTGVGDLYSRGARVVGGAGVPVYLVTGRYDMLCPPAWAHNLAREVYRQVGGVSRCVVVEGAAHSELDPGMKEAMISAITDMQL